MKDYIEKEIKRMVENKEEEWKKLIFWKEQAYILNFTTF